MREYVYDKESVEASFSRIYQLWNCIGAFNGEYSYLSRCCPHLR